MQGRKELMPKMLYQVHLQDLIPEYNFYRLLDIYVNSQDTGNDIWFIKDKIEKMKALDNGLLPMSTNKKEYFFENFYPHDESDILKFSNGKLKKDWISNIP